MGLVGYCNGWMYPVVSRNHTIQFTISSNPTTGYDWIIGTTCDQEGVFSHEYSPTPVDEDIMGSGGVTTITFEAQEDARGLRNCDF